MVLLNTRDKGQYIFGGLSIRTFEVTVISVAKFLIACLVSDIFKDKDKGTCQPLYHVYGGWLVSLVYQYFRNKTCYQKFNNGYYNNFKGS